MRSNQPTNQPTGNPHSLGSTRVDTKFQHPVRCRTLGMVDPTLHSQNDSQKKKIVEEFYGTPCTPLKTNMEHHGVLVQIIFLSKWVICRFHVNLTGCTWGPAPPRNQLCLAKTSPLPVEQTQLLCGRLVAKPREAKPEGKCIGGRIFDFPYGSMVSEIRRPCW